LDRPIPWKLDGRAYPLMDKLIPAYKDLALGTSFLGPNTTFLIPTIQILDFDLGEDNHTRYNHFLTIVQTSQFGANDNIALLQTPSSAQRKYPFAELNSIARHGFRPMHCEVNSLVQLGVNSDGKADPTLLIQFNEILYDYWNNAIFFESGSMRIIGSNDVKAGKVVSFDQDAPYNANKVFYVEGYSDEFLLEGEKGVPTWQQTLTLTRGIDIDALRNFKNPNANATDAEQNALITSIAKRNKPFTDNGSFSGNSGV
jgi:hypothetical protein